MIAHKNSQCLRSDHNDYHYSHRDADWERKRDGKTGHHLFKAEPKVDEDEDALKGPSPPEA